MCVDPNGLSRSPERPYLHYVVMPSPIGVADQSAGVSHAASNSFGSLYLSPRTMMGPGHPRNLVGEGDGSHFRGSALHQPAEPRSLLRSVLARVADDGHCADDDRLLHAAQRHRQARRQDIGAQYAGLSAGGALPSGARRLARPAYPVGAVGERDAATDLKDAIQPGARRMRSAPAGSPE